MIYFDASFLFRLYWDDEGFAEVRKAARAASVLVCAQHGRAEVASSCHRKFREGVATAERLAELINQFQEDCVQGGIVWLPFTAGVFDRVEHVYLKANADVYLRAADALHLACAAEHGLKEIHSNDRHLLASAPLFGLRGVNVIHKAASR